MIFQRMILVYTVMFLISLLMLICTQNVWSHEVSQSTAQKALYIPELKLYSKPLIVSGNAHLHIGSVSQPSKPGGGRYTCNPIPESRLNKVADLIQATLKQNKIKTYMGLEYLIVCGEVTANGQKIGGIPVPPLHLLMLSMVNQTDESVAHLFWHEFFHYLEFKTGTYKDRSWESQFSGYTQRYELEGAHLTKLGSGSSGFINLYGQSFPHEERAEIAAWWFSAPSKLTSYLRQANDIMLEQKLSYMRKKMRDLGIE